MRHRCPTARASCSTARSSGVSPVRPATATMPCSARGCSWTSPCPCRSPSPGLPANAPEIAAVLFMVVPVAEQLASLVGCRGRCSGMGERLRLIQWSEQGSEQVIAGPDPRVVSFTLGEPLAPGQARPYGPLTRADGGELFAVGAAVPGLPWTVLHEIDATAALAPLRQFALAALVSGRLGGPRPGARLCRVLVAPQQRSPARARGAVSRSGCGYPTPAAAAREHHQRHAGDALSEDRRTGITPTSIRRSPTPSASPRGTFSDTRTVELFGGEVAAQQAASDRRALDGVAVKAETRPGRAARAHARTCRPRGCACATKAAGPPVWSR